LECLVGGFRKDLASAYKKLRPLELIRGSFNLQRVRVNTGINSDVSERSLRMEDEVDLSSNSKNLVKETRG
jgi:hypothetical protein